MSPEVEQEPFSVPTLVSSDYSATVEESARAVGQFGAALELRHQLSAIAARGDVGNLPMDLRARYAEEMAIPERLARTMLNFGEHDSVPSEVEIAAHIERFSSGRER